MIFELLAVMGGMMIAMQSSCNGMIFSKLGFLQVGLISLSLNAVANFLFHGIQVRKVPNFRKTPMSALFAGFCALVCLGLGGWCAAMLGTAISVCLSVSGQLLTSAVIDHFGFFGTKKISFKPQKLFAFFWILAGICIINFSGMDVFTSIPNRKILCFYLFLAVFTGVIVVLSRMFTYEATKCVGKFAGCGIGCGFGAILAFLIVLLTSDRQLNISIYTELPKFAFLSGPLGCVATYFNNMAYDRIKIFSATIALLVGQILAGIIADVIIYQSFPLQKLAGIICICIGIMLEKRISYASE